MPERFSHRHLHQTAYGLTMVLSSAGGLVLEIVAGRLLAPYVGMSLYTWTAIIAVVLAGFSLGNWLGGRLATADLGGRRGSRRVALALALAALSSLAALPLLRLLAGAVLSSGLGPIAAISLLAAALFLLPSLFVGVVSPLITTLAIDLAPAARGRIIGRMYALGALGSIVGTLAAGFVFISWLGSTVTVLVVAATYGVLALGFALASGVRTTLAPALVVLALGGALAGGGSRLQAFTSPCQEESAYFCIRVVDLQAGPGAGSEGGTRVMVLDHLGHGINVRDEPGFLLSPYIQFVDEIARRRLGRPQSAFFIGGGPYTLPRAWHRPGRNLVVAELDPAVTRAARRHLWLDTKGLDIRHGDARAVLQGLPADSRFDVIFGDAFKDVSIPPHLVTEEFHAQVARRLSPRGFYVVNVVEGGTSPLFLYALVQTLRREFATVEVWIEDDATASGRVTYVVLAASRPTPAGTLTAARGPARSWSRLSTQDMLVAAKDAGVPVLRDDFAPVDRLMSHLLLDPALVE